MTKKKSHLTISLTISNTYYIMWNPLDTLEKMPWLGGAPISGGK